MHTEYYDILGIEVDADYVEIKRAYRKLATQHHPDKGGDAELFKKISKAYSILSNPEKREAYNLRGEEEAVDKYGLAMQNLFVYFNEALKQAAATYSSVEVTGQHILDIVRNSCILEKKAAVEHKSRLTKDLEFLNKFKDKVQVKDECELNVYQEIITNNIREVEKLREKSKHDIEVLKMSIEMLGHYEAKGLELFTIPEYFKDTHKFGTSGDTVYSGSEFTF
jgi:curved DNA-binding protein CbpA